MRETTPSQDYSPKPPRKFYGQVIVTSSFLISLIVFGGYNAFGVFFNPMMEEFNWSSASTSAAFSISTLAQGFFALLSGRLTDKYGPRLIMTLCSFALGGGYLLMSVIDNLLQFYLVYGIIIGIGVGGFWVPVLSVVSRWYNRKRGFMLGVVYIGTATGILITPPLLNLMITNLDWRNSLTILGVITLFMCVIGVQFLKRDPSQIHQHMDGNIQMIMEEHDINEGGLTLKEASRTLSYWLLIGVYVIYGFCAYIVMVHLVPFSLFLHISSTTSANFLALIGGISGIAGFITGVMGDRTAAKKVVVLCMGAMMVSLLWLIFSYEIWSLVLFCVVFSIGFAGMGLVENIICVKLFGLKSNALILATVDLGLIIGAASGPLIAGYLFDSTKSYTPAFIMIGILGVAGFLLAVLVKPNVLMRDRKL